MKNLDLENSFPADILAEMQHDNLLLESQSFGNDTPAILRAHDSLGLEIHLSGLCRKLLQYRLCDRISHYSVDGRD